MPQVEIERKVMKVPTVDDPEREVYQITYTQGLLPPRFIFIPVKEYSKELEAQKIKEDIAARDSQTKEQLEI